MSESNEDAGHLFAEATISTVEAVSKGSGIDALREGDKSIPARILAAGKQFFLPTLSAYLRVENGQLGATPKEAMQNDLKAAAACLIDIGTYAIATHYGSTRRSSRSIYGQILGR